MREDEIVTNTIMKTTHQVFFFSSKEKPKFTQRKWVYAFFYSFLFFLEDDGEEKSKKKEKKWWTLFGMMLKVFFFSYVGDATEPHSGFFLPTLLFSSYGRQGTTRTSFSRRSYQCAPVLRFVTYSSFINHDLLEMLFEVPSAGFDENFYTVNSFLAFI